VGLDDPACEGEAEADATGRAGAALVGAEERREHARLISELDAGAAIEQVTPALLAALDQAGARVASVVPFGLLRSALDDHVLVLTRAAIALAAIIALVGLLGLGAAMGISVLERTREIGVMKA